MYFLQMLLQHPQHYPRLQQYHLQHREGKGSAFCRRYGLKRLVYAEEHDSIEDAIAREKAMKAWKRAWKIELVEGVNPEWDDLFGVVL